MKTQELRQLSPIKLYEELNKAIRELASTRFHVRTGKNQNIAEIKKFKTTIAQIKTLLTKLKNTGADITPPKKEKKSSKTYNQKNS